jgi:hypothetical protein
MSEEFHVLLGEIAPTVGSELDVLTRFSNPFCVVIRGDARKAKEGEIVGKVLTIPSPDPF